MAGEESNGKETYLAFVAEEGLVSLLDRNEVMNFHRKNGSLFNYPAATAAVLVHRYDDKALQYLNSIVSIFGSAGTCLSNFVSEASPRVKILAIYLMPLYVYSTNSVPTEYILSALNGGYAQKDRNISALFQ